jgi:molecular chaperone DnaK
MGKIIGIDFGTTSSAVAVMQDGRPAIIPNQEGARCTPSVVAFDEHGGALVGESARRQAITNPENTASSTKRLLGRKLADPITQQAIRHAPFEVAAASNGDTAFAIQRRRYSPAVVAARVLEKLKRAAEAHLREDVTEAVIAVPVSFNYWQREATREAGQLAGLRVARILNEPTAAALAYGFDRAQEQSIAVFAMGGGSADISILQLGDNVVEVVATHGDAGLGGDDIDSLLIDWLVAEFANDTGIDLGRRRAVMPRIKEAVEQAKIALSVVEETQIDLPYLVMDAAGPKHLVRSLSRSRFESIVAAAVQRGIDSCKQALADAGVKAADIHNVLLVGGSTFIPLVQRRIKELFGRAPNRSVDALEAVALGAAVQGGVLAGELDRTLVLDVVPRSLAVEGIGGVATVVIPRNTTFPTRSSETVSTHEADQTHFTVHVTEGERPLTKDNLSLAFFELAGIQSAPRGVAQIEVTFDIDADGILLVTAKDKVTGAERAFRVGGSEPSREAPRPAQTRPVDTGTPAEMLEARARLAALIENARRLAADRAATIDTSKTTQIRELLAEAARVLARSGSRDELRAEFSRVQWRLIEIANLQVVA